MIETIRRAAFHQKFILVRSACGPERLLPALARRGSARDDKTLILNTQIDGVAETALLDYGLGDSHPARVANSYKFDSHPAKPVL
jgi:hypothetical protein